MKNIWTGNFFKVKTKDELTFIAKNVRNEGLLTIIHRQNVLNDL
jgi:hypothetical protein